MLNTPRKRASCARCLRPHRGCFCHLLQTVANRIEVLILQDKTEATNAKNTGHLLHLSLENSRVKQFDANAVLDNVMLQTLLYQGDKSPLLLYPPTPELSAMGLEMPANAPTMETLDPDRWRLVVIDATWRKSRKVLYLNPSLQRLSRFALKNPPKSLYLIRKAANENQLSTLEASCYALQQLEQGIVDYSPLLIAMQEFVAQQAAFRPV